jgi:hypothetical protein
MGRVKEKLKLVVEYGDGHEVVEALRPVLTARGYVVVPNSSLADQQDDRAQRRELADELDALDRLFEIASHDTHQSRRVADFLLAWWNARRDGGFDLTSLWNLDDKICADLSIVFELIARSRNYPDAYGYDAAIRRLVEQWRLPTSNK